MKILDEDLFKAAAFSPRSLIEPLAWCGHIPFASWLMRVVRPHIFVELGTHAGNSYFAFCQAAQEFGLSVKCYAVDTWKGDDQAGYYGEDVFRQVSIHNQQHYNDFSCLLRMTFDEAFNSFKNGSIDLLHIDGLHTYEAVKHDFETWLPKLAPGAVVVFHDTNMRETDFGVWRLWDELCEQYSHHFEFLHSHGLGVLQIEGEQKGYLPWLAPEYPAQQPLRQYFSVLGTRLREKYSYERDIAELREVIKEHRSVLSDREEKLSGLNAQLSEVTLRMIEFEAQLSEATIRLSERDAQLFEATGRLAEREAQLSEATGRLAERDAQLSEGAGHLAERDAQLAAINSEVMTIYSTVSWRITKPLRYLSARKRSVNCRISQLKLTICNKGGLIASVRKALRVLRREGVSGLRIRFKRDLNKPPSYIHQSPIAFLSEKADLLTDSHRIEIIPYYIDSKIEQGSHSLNFTSTVAIHIHLYYLEMINEFISRLQSMPCAFDLFVSIPPKGDAASVKDHLRKALGSVHQIIVEEVPNRGRDLAPMIIQFGPRLAGYDVIAHVHTKKSPHCNRLSGWCQHILDLLLGTPGNNGGRIAHIIELLRNDAKFVYPEGQTQIIKDRSGLGANYELAARLLEKHGELSIYAFPIVDFPEGSMFWARGQCMKEFLRLGLDWDDFPSEPIPADGTLAHTLERLLLILPSQHPGRIYRVHQGDSIHEYRNYEEQQDFSDRLQATDLKVLAYFLPQFHPIPENDLWHGKGFTEWTKVRAANPLFEGHYQQHIPHPDLGYYLLDTPQTLRKQSELMRKACVFGQVFYHYWFAGKLILEQPARMLLETPDIDMPFCFCWANENWTRRWDGNESEILLKQDYSPQDALDFIRYLIPFFQDARYIRIEDRPVLFVYRPSSLPDPLQYIDIWAGECAEHGMNPPYVVAVLTRGATDPRDFGMDAGVERVLHDWTAEAVPEMKHSLHSYQPLQGSVLDYDQVADFYIEQSQPKEFIWFRSLIPIWDNTARYGDQAFLVHGSTPSKFSQWLEHSFDYSRQHLPHDRRFILINAWNEWAEGAHLEPDSRYGYAYLNAVGRTLCGLDYGVDLNPLAPLQSRAHVQLIIPDEILALLHEDELLTQRFLACLSRSTVFNCCDVEVHPPGLINLLHDVARTKVIPPRDETPDFILQIRRIALFSPELIEKMLQTAHQLRATVVLSNAYDRCFPLIEGTENGSIDSACAYEAPLLLLPGHTENGYKNYRFRSDSHSFVAYPGTLSSKQLTRVTTIIRYHRSADMGLLRNALYCLAAMQDCLVMPLVAAQDLDAEQIVTLQEMITQIPWPEGSEPRILPFHSPGAKGDLRAQMLNEALKQVTTRYAGFLDYDDLLMSHAYAWLLQRLRQTGKSVSFGRVYSTTYDRATGRFLGRKREFTYGLSYDDYLAYNHAPLHSFLLDLSQFELEQIHYYDDQRYLEDYYLTLQLFTRENADWESLAHNVYIGDYLHLIGGCNTLAHAGEQSREKVVASPMYRLCETRINNLKRRLEQDQLTWASSRRAAF